MIALHIADINNRSPPASKARANQRPVMYHFRFTFILVVIGILSQSHCSHFGGDVVFVKSLNVTCPYSFRPCIDLNWFANHSDLLRDNATVEFLYGTHVLNTPFIITTHRNLTFRARREHSTSWKSYPVDIHCSSSYFSFVDVFDLTIQGLRFHGCGTAHSDPTFYSAALQFSNVDYFHVFDVCIHESIGPGVSATNVFGISTIDRSSFVNNTGTAPHVYVTYDGSLSRHNYSVLVISNSEFRNGGGGSLSILFDSYHTSDIDIFNITTSGSAPGGTAGGDVEILLKKTAWYLPVEVNISSSNIEDSAGTGIYIAPWMGFGSTLYSAIGNIRIRGCVVAGHKQGAIFFFNPTTLVYEYGLTIENSQVIHNVLQSSQDELRKGAGLTLIYRAEETDDTQSPVVMRNVTFERNDHIDIPLGMRPTTVYIAYAQSVNIVDCNFLHNHGSGILAYGSSLVLSGTLAFVNNSAYQGGALALYGGSSMVVPRDTNIAFCGNYAAHDGGAVYTDSSERNQPLSLLAQAPRCFLQLPDLYDLPDIAFLNVTLNFTNNAARNGGNDIYGGLIDECSVAPNAYEDIILGFEILNTSTFIFNDANQSNLSRISSDPWRVCVCSDGVPDCTIVFINRTLHPGEEFSVSAAIVGQRFGTISGSIYGNFLLQNESETVAELGEFWQHSQSSGPSKCSEVTYSIFSNATGVVLTLTASDAVVVKYLDNETVQNAILNYRYSKQISTELLSFPVYINVTLLPCPLGFVLSGRPPRCVCDPQVTEFGLTCDINNHVVQRSGTVWVNASFHGSTTDGVIVYKYCPFSYCKSKEIQVNLNDPDTQCAFNRSGTLCGRCSSGLSLALGTSKCLTCSNAYLALLVPFALAGIVLVFFIRFLNLTVAIGTINGLIFYANVIKANQAVFFPAGETSVLTVFISWLNLDLGIESCFFNGLSQYEKTWLQFIFPLYIWFIVIVIIGVSRYSSTIARVFGYHTVPLLSTLFLLSYTKLLRTIIAVFSVTTIKFPDGSQTAVWAYDGNIKYLGALHAPLFIVALVFLLVLWIPYTVLLLFGQCLLRMDSQYKPVHLLIKLKPFFDSYFGPFKDRHRYWVGGLLLARIALFLTFAYNSTNEPSINLLAVSTTVLVLLMYTSSVGQVYRFRYLTLLESSFLLNAMVFTLGTFYNQLAGGNQTALAYTLVSIAFLEFIAIVISHGFVAFRRRGYTEIPSSPESDYSPESSIGSRYLHSQDSTSGHVQRRSSGEQNTVDFSSEFFAAAQRFTQLREPLLDSS